jgi:hypothetical protein
VNRPRHPKKEIEEALQYAEANGWRVIKRSGRGHAWGILRCVLENREGCSMSVWSTPRDPAVHGMQIMRRVDQCNHK